METVNFCCSVYVWHNAALIPISGAWEAGERIGGAAAVEIISRPASKGLGSSEA